MCLYFCNSPAQALYLKTHVYKNKYFYLSSKKIQNLWPLKNIFFVNCFPSRRRQVPITSPDIITDPGNTEAYMVKCCTCCVFYLLFIDLELFSNWVCFTLQAAGEIEPYSIFIQTENWLYSASKINLNHITWNTFYVNWRMNLQHFYNKYLFPSE